ncbi:MAG: hypothetical protein NT084_07830 [Bacteroidetes bacterium]|nr:hypothetical protein [Bacteroidota bacterium]
MKKNIFALAIVAFSGLFFASCKTKEKCDAYKSSIPSHHTGAQTNS